MSIARERLSQEESRSAALAAARRLLIAQGPQAVTLKAVAAEIGKTHANLLHHFGSLRKLRAATIEEIAAVPGFGTKTALAVKVALDAKPAGEAIDMATGEVLAER